MTAKRLQWIFAFVTALSGAVLLAQNPVSISQVGTTAVTTTVPVSGTVTANAGSGTLAVSGTFWQATQPVSGTVTANMGTVTADPFGANADAASATGSISAKLKFIAGTGIPITGNVAVTGTFWQATQPVSVASGQVASGAVASGAYASGSISDGAMVTLGAKADAKSTATDTTAITAMQVLKEISAVTQAVPPPISGGTLASGAITSAMTGTTSTSLIAATASNYIYVTSCSFSNTHASVTTMMLLQDGSGGTTLWEGINAFGGGSNITFPVPLKVPTAGNALFVQNVTTGSNTFASCSGYKSTVSY